VSETDRQEEYAAVNTDRELWREPTDEVGMEYYQPSIHVTARGGIGINVGGLVIVKSLRDWHALAAVEVKQQIEQARHAEALKAYAEANGMTVDEARGKFN
jgi:hypothetical protein